MRHFLSTNSFNSVGAGQTATLDLPVGAFTYHSIRITYGTSVSGGGNLANIKAHITAVRIKVDGKVQRRFSAAELIAINAFNGIAFQTGVLPIYLSEPWRRSPQGEDALAWGTGDISTFQIEVDIASAGTAPTLSAKMEVERVRRPMNAIVKWRKFSVPVAATGELTVTTLPRTDAYYRLHAFEDTDDDISAVRVTVDQLEVFNAARAEIEGLYSHSGLSPQASVFTVAFDRTQRVADGLAMRNGDAGSVQDFRLDFTMAGANTFSLVTEVVGPRD